MAKNGGAKKSQLLQVIRTSQKLIKELNEQNVKIIKSIEEMNAENIYAGGKSANDWYAAADASVTSNKAFIEKLEEVIKKYQNIYKKMVNVSKG
ncbi:MAG: hypothetical protein E7158_05540 [Firmicutes bacterium]|nr:hypothetical protein [Bacillota bacterium]